MAVSNIDQEIAASHISDAAKSILEVFTRRNEAKTIRPSFGIACARQTYYSLQGEDSGKMPDHIGSTFAVGHLLHELSYAAVKSAIPEGFTVSTEVKTDLPDWWPTDIDHFNQKGHVDMLISCDSREAWHDHFLPPDQPNTLLVELERDLFARVATSPEGSSYGETLFNVTRTGAYKEIHRELDRLHARAGKYLQELKELANERE